jgi:hypothetical protein
MQHQATAFYACNVAERTGLTFSFHVRYQLLQWYFVCDECSSSKKRKRMFFRRFHTHIAQNVSSTQQKFLRASTPLDGKTPWSQVQLHQVVHLSSSALEI